MRRALFLAPYFLPRRRVGSMRPFRFVAHLREFGWQPSVITIRSREDRLTPAEEDMLRGIEIVEIAPPFDRTLRAESQLRTPGIPVLGERSLASRTVAALDRQFPVDSWSLLFLLQYRRLLRELRRIEPEVIWATGDPWSSLVIGAMMAERTGVPFIADFRDPWTLCDVRTDRRWTLSRTVDSRFERRVLERADWVLFQAEETEATYRQHYAHMNLRTSTITNSFSRILMDKATGDSPRLGLPRDRLSICFFGRFRSMSPASIVTDALYEAGRKDAELMNRIDVYSFGTLNPEDEAYARHRGVVERFRTLEAVPLERAVSLLSQFDLLLLSTDTRRREIIPAKLFEYLPSGRPILSLSLNPEVSRILEQTGTGIQRDPRDTGSLAELLLASVRATLAGSALPLRYSPRADQIERFEAHVTTGELAALFEAVSRADAS